MKIYRNKIPEIANHIISSLANEGQIEVSAANRTEAEQDIVSILEEYLRRDNELREVVKERMSRGGIGYDQYGRIRSRLAEEWNHPIGEDVPKYLARQFVENFMISRFIDEVYADDGPLWRRTLDLLRTNDVDERALREEARSLIKNAAEGTVEYELAFQQAMRDVRKRKGLI